MKFQPQPKYGATVHDLVHGMKGQISDKTSSPFKEFISGIGKENNTVAKGRTKTSWEA